MRRLRSAIDKAEAIVVGAGAGLSTSAGLTYAGERFERLFPDFIARYGFADMYSAGFHPYETPEERWAFWSRYVWCNRYEPAPKDTYGKLLRLLGASDFFVVTTNVDHQFQLAGFPKERLFYTQGDYGLWQCGVPCHDVTYDNHDEIRRMVTEQRDMRVPSELVPHCPVCGEPMSMNLRADDTFVEDEGWHAAARRYSEYLEEHQRGRILYLELGVGGNTPAIIKYPFWRRTYDNPDATYACVNYEEAITAREIADRSIIMDSDIDAVLDELLDGEGRQGTVDESRKLQLLRYLVGELCAERNMEVPEARDAGELWSAFRALVNTRPPWPQSEGLLAAQDELLRGLIREAGIHGIDEATPSPTDAGLLLWRGDITTLATDAIVNAANSQMLGCWVPGHHCIDNAIHTYAGIELRAECARIMQAQGTQEPTGQAKVTDAYNLPARRIIHTVGPIANGCPTTRHRAQLAMCYRSCLDAAASEGLRSVAFCCISTGIFGFPQREAAEIAVRTVRAWQKETGPGISVVFNVFGDEDERIYRQLLDIH